jgi:hypothetical protein
VSAHQFSSQRRQPIELPIGPAVFDGDVSLFDIPGFAQAFAECRQPFGGRLRRTEMQKSNHWHRLLLRAPRAATRLPRRRAA